MKFENTRVFGLENAITGMRLPMCKDFTEAQEKCDSVIEHNGDNNFGNNIKFGEKDLKLARGLVSSDKNGCGQPNSKFLRMIHVQCAVTAPLTWWKEFDTYKVGTTANSTSTMHRIMNYPVTEDCFEKNPYTGQISSAIDLNKLESLRLDYSNVMKELKDYCAAGETDEKAVKILKDNAKTLWYELVYGIGDSWLQTRMVDLDYATIRNMYFWRKNHKQNCWSGKDNSELDNFCKWIETLPYAQELLVS